jgi:hypothetical protein
MQAAIKYYSLQGYVVEDVSQQNRGYDILCKRIDGILRVEVKGLQYSPHPVMTQNEYRMAEFYQDNFILFILKVNEHNHRMYIVHNPLAHLDITLIDKPAYRVTGYDTFETAPVSETTQSIIPTNDTSRDEVVIIKGQMNKATNTIEQWFSQLSGDIMAELDFIDRTTFGYLDEIPKHCGIRVITSHIKNEERCSRSAEKTARDRPYLEIIRINKVHERWIGSETSFFILLGTDLKTDALGKSTHTIRKMSPNAFTETISNFNHLWNTSPTQLKQRYGRSLKKGTFYSYTQQAR